MTEEVIVKKFNLDGTHQQLLDINSDAANFSAEFQVVPFLLDMEIPYKVSLTNQGQMDNNEKLEFNEVKGIFSGSVKNEDGEPQNYFLAIQSSAPMKQVEFKVKIFKFSTISSEESQHSDNAGHVQNYKQEQEAQAQAQAQAQAEQDQTRELQKRRLEMIRIQYEDELKKRKFNYKLMFAFFVIVAGGFLLYYFHKKEKKAAAPITKSGMADVLTDLLHED
jgi:hypothetical protein